MSDVFQDVQTYQLPVGVLPDQVLHLQSVQVSSTQGQNDLLQGHAQLQWVQDDFGGNQQEPLHIQLVADAMDPSNQFCKPLVAAAMPEIVGPPHNKVEQFFNLPGLFNLPGIRSFLMLFSWNTNLIFARFCNFYTHSFMP